MRASMPRVWTASPSRWRPRGLAWRVVAGPALAGLVLAGPGGCASPPPESSLRLERGLRGPEDAQASRPVARVELASGLVIEDLALGDGALCVPGALVVVDYTGELDDGTVFDSTRGVPPRTLPLDRLIEGWREGLPGMRVGGERRLIVPASLGYGERGWPPLAVPPDARLTFRVTLLDVRWPRP